MKKIIIFGAGRSSTSLIDYLLSIAEEQQIFITLLDYNEELAKSKIKIINLVKPTSLMRIIKMKDFSS